MGWGASGFATEATTLDWPGAAASVQDAVLAGAQRLKARSSGRRAPINDEGFERLEPPAEGDWRAEHPEEKFQSIEKYLRELENRITPQRRTIYIQPLGRIARERAKLLETVREYMAAFFGAETRLLPAIEPPEGAWVAGREQYEAGRLLDFLAQRAPKDAAVIAGFIEEDIFTDDDNFVFGLAQEQSRAGVFSLARLGERYRGSPKGATLERRMLALASHELGHVFGVDHCVRYRCVMEGSNSLEESDRQPMQLCPIDLEKLRLDLGFDPLRRYEALEGFYGRHGYAAEAAFCAARRAALAGRPGSEPSGEN